MNASPCQQTALTSKEIEVVMGWFWEHFGLDAVLSFGSGLAATGGIYAVIYWWTGSGKDE